MTKNNDIWLRFNHEDIWGNINYYKKDLIAIVLYNDENSAMCEMQFSKKDILENKQKIIELKDDEEFMEDYTQKEIDWILKQLEEIEKGVYE